jgi:hypothetical protein
MRNTQCRADQAFREMSRVVALAAGLFLGVLLGAYPGRGVAACTGDCDGGGTVTVNEVITMVDIALGSSPPATCAPGDADGSGDITVDEIVAAVNNALDTCPLPTATPTFAPSSSTPTSTSTPRPTSTPTPTSTPLGARHFVLSPENSTFTAVLSTSTSFVLGGFAGQKDGVTGQVGYLDLDAGQTDDRGFATIDIVEASDYLYVDATAQAQIVVCIKPIVPVTNAGLLACKGGVDVSIAVTQNHHLGMIGTDDFTAAQCTSLGGSIENAPHPGVCNGPLEVSQLGGDSGPGSVTISPIPQLGLNGLPVEIGTERALPCGDEGPGQPALFAFTSATFRSMILNLNNITDICSAGATGTGCATNADCDSAPAAGDGICGATLRSETHGENFSCPNWQAADAPGCLVFSAPQLDANPLSVAGDLVTAFSFCGR